jgi:hypothetical protein
MTFILGIGDKMSSVDFVALLLLARKLLLVVLCELFRHQYS